MGRILSDVVLQKTVPAFRASPDDPPVKLVNFSRCRSLAAIMAGKSLSIPVPTLELTRMLDMIRFQQPYTLKEVVEIQQYLNYTLDSSRLTTDTDEMDRRRCVFRAWC